MIIEVEIFFVLLLLLGIIEELVKIRKLLEEKEWN